MEDCNPVGSGQEISINQPEDKLLKGGWIEKYQALVEAMQYLAQVTRYDNCSAVDS